MSEEDKSTPTSSEYWFRVMDRDGDGAITIDDLEFFYAEQVCRMLDDWKDFFSQETRLRTLGVEPLPFLDLLCLMLDLVKPEQKHLITLRDLKKCRLQHIFFDTFLNAEKYLDRCRFFFTGIFSKPDFLENSVNLSTAIKNGTGRVGRQKSILCSLRMRMTSNYDDAFLNNLLKIPPCCLLQ